MWVPLSFMFVFFYSYAKSAILALSHSTCLCLSPTMWKAWALGLASPPFIPFVAWTLSWRKALPVQPVGLPFLLLHFLPCLWACHVSPLGLLPFPLGSCGPFTLLLPLVRPMNLLYVIPVMLAHWIYYLFSWASTTHLLYFYLLLCPWACWLSFLPCWPIGFITSFLGFSRPICFTFTSCCAHGSAGCHSCHVGPLGLLPLFLGFHDQFTLLLPLPFPFFSHLPLLLGFFCHWAFCQQLASTIFSINSY